LNDRLAYLDFLHQLNDPEFSSYLTKLEKEVAEKPVDLEALLSWMSGNNLNLLALDFVKSLPVESAQTWPTALAIAEIYARLGDWHKLETATKAANWQQFDFLRHAYLARALRGQEKPAAAEHEWASAVKVASSQSESLLSLIKTSSEWKWTNETVDLLWAMTKYPEKESEALRTLYRIYAASGDSQGLYRVLARLSQAGSENLDLKNNLAQISLLLNANPDDARRLAAEVYRKAPSNAAYAATYAYSLLTKGDPTGAVKIMRSLSEDQLRDPSISVYYGICLAAVRDDQAKSFLEAGQKAHLLPEEKALVDKALSNLDSQRRIQ
jgi:hypothetical protein